MSNSSKGVRARLILLRHGQSLWNAERRLAGQADVSISQLGQEQILHMQASVHALKPTSIIASDLRRACESAALLGFDSPKMDQRLREANLGAWQGQYIADLEQAQYQAWRVGQFTPPDGESWQAFCDRVEDILTELIARDGRYLIVTHGGVIRAACDRLLGLSPRQIVPVSPASLTIIDVNDQPRLSVFNLAHDFSLNRFD